MQSFPGLSTVETRLNDIVRAINGLNSTVTDVGTDVTGVASAITAAFPPPLTSSATFDPANLLTLTQDIATLTVTGAALGNAVKPSFSLDLQGITLSGYVSAANTVKVVFFNGTSGTINLASGTVKARVYT